MNVSVSPKFISVHVGQAEQFAPIFPTGVKTKLTWSVNGIVGGDSTFGTISATGLYRAPMAVPPASTVTIKATAASGFTSTSGTAAVVTGLARYVSASGSDGNPGTIGLPWRTIQHAANLAVAGDTIFVRAGVYHEMVSIRSSGSARGGPIVLQSYPGETAIVDGTGVACCSNTIRGLFNLWGNYSYIVIEGFEIRNFSSGNSNNIPAGIWVSGSGSNISFLNNTIHGITEYAGRSGAAMGIGISAYKSTPISNIHVLHNTIYGIVAGVSEALFFDGNVDGFEAIGNVIHDNNCNALDMIGFWGTGPSGFDQARNGEVSGNTIYNNTALNNPTFYGYAAGGIYCDGCANVVIEHNTVYNNDLNIAIASENYGHASSYVTVRNNLIYNPNAMALSIGGWQSSSGGSDHITMVNNTILGSTTKDFAGNFQVGYNATNNIFENNIVYGGVAQLMFHGYAPSSAVPVTSDYNIYYTTGPVPMWYWDGQGYNTLASFQAASKQDAHSTTNNPKPVSLVPPYNLDVQPGSPAINHGNFGLGTRTYGTTDYANNPRVSGAAIDIGAYQK